MSIRSDKINATYLALSDYGADDHSKKRKAKKPLHNKLTRYDLATGKYNSERINVTHRALNDFGADGHSKKKNIKKPLHNSDYETL